VFAALGLWRFAIYAAVALAIFGSLAYAKHSYDAKQQEIGAQPWRDKYNALVADVEKQKKEAAEVLKVETEKAAKVSKSWADYARSSDDEYEKKIAAIRAAANSANGMRLISTERWNSSACPAAGKDDTGASKGASTSGKFLAELDAFLRSEANRADEIAEYALSCHKYVNKEP
jgi:hypothetical protein